MKAHASLNSLVCKVPLCPTFLLDLLSRIQYFISAFVTTFLGNIRQVTLTTILGADTWWVVSHCNTLETQKAQFSEEANTTMTAAYGNYGRH